MPVLEYPQDRSATPESEEQFDLSAYWRTIVRRRWLIIPFFAATMLVTTLVTLRATRIYDATCTIIIDLSAPKVLDSEQVKDVAELGSGAYYFSKEFYETQYKVITSRAVAQRVVDTLQLGTNLKFLDLDSISDTAARARRQAKLDPVEILQRHLKLEPVKDSHIVRLRYEDRDPQQAALIANAIADAYITDNLAVRSSTTRNASDWLEQQLADLELKLRQSGEALFAFKKANDILSTSWEDRQSMVSQRLTAINDALTKTRVQKAQLAARNESIQSLANAPTPGDETGAETFGSLSSPAIQQLKLRYVEAKTECADIRSRYLDQHPKTVACTDKVDLARKTLQHEIRAALATAAAEYREVADAERNLSTLYDKAKADAFTFNQHEREYSELKRAYDDNARLYDLVLKRLKDTGITAMLQVSNVRILDRARTNFKPVRPDVTENYLLAVILALLGGVGLAFGAERLDSSLTTQDQVEEKLGLTLLGIVPSIEKHNDGSPQDLIVHTHPQSPVAECVRSIRTNLLFMSPEKPFRTILVTSSGPQDGKTTASTSLAVAMAESGSRVLLVDADMRRPRLHRVFGLGGSTGLSSLILGGCNPGDAIGATAVPNLFVLPCGPVPPNPAELLHTASFAALLKDLSTRFDRLVIDSPPVGVVSDAVILSTQVDGTLIVLKAGKTSREVAKRAVRQLRDVKANIFGAILNDLNLEDQKYGHYYYYYRYGYYYRDKGEPPAAS